MKYWDYRESGKPQYDYLAYTDGSYLLPKNFGASACIVLDGECYKPLYQWSEVSRYSTSHRQELAAIVHALLHAAGEDDLDPDARRRMRRREREVMTALERDFDFSELFPERREP